MALVELDPRLQDTREYETESFDAEESQAEYGEPQTAETVVAVEVDPVVLMASYVKTLRGASFKTADVAQFKPDFTAMQRMAVMKDLITRIRNDDVDGPLLRWQGRTKAREYWIASVLTGSAAHEGIDWFNNHHNIEIQNFEIASVTELRSVQRLLRDLFDLKRKGVREIQDIPIKNIFQACNESIANFTLLPPLNMDLPSSPTIRRIKNAQSLNISTAQDNDNPSFMDNGNCHGVDPVLFFPSRGEPVAPAKAVCSGCPVKDECLEYALQNCERYGVWGGKSERERRRIRSSRLKASRAEKLSQN